MAGPRIVIEHARKLIAQFDKPSDDEKAVFRTVALKQADSAQMVKAIKEMMSSSIRRPVGRVAKKGTSSFVSPNEPELKVVEAPGGGAVVLHGLLEDVERAAEWIEQLDNLATRGRKIKVYKIKHADVKSLGELIVNVVIKPVAKPAKGRPTRARKGIEPLKEEEEEFALTKTWAGPDLYIQADLVANTMIVAASDSKLSEIEDIIAQFDTEEADLRAPPIPKFVYELRHAEAFDAAFDLEMALEQLWDPPDELPQVSSAFFGNSIVVAYPHEDRFPEIKEIIRKYIDNPRKGESNIKKMGFATPRGISATNMAMWIKMNHPELDVEIIDTSTSKDDTFGLERVAPQRPANTNPCVLPRALLRMVNDVVAIAPGQSEQRDDRGNDKDTNRRTANEQSSPEHNDGVLETAIRSMLADDAARGQPDESGDDSAARMVAEERAQKVKIFVDDATGNVIIEGPSGLLDDVPDWIKELEEEIEKLKRPPDIRVIRVRYIDVYSAAGIIEEMFNATRQQRQAVTAAQRRQQQLQRQQQQRQRQQQQQKQAGQQSTQQQRPGQRGQQPQVAVPQLPEPAVRVFPNPRDRTLILRAETNQYPAILELLATIDQPQPIDSELRIFKLTKLNAVEVEEVLESMLGLNQKPTGGRAPTRAGGRRPNQAAGTRQASGGQLPRTIMQETVSGSILGIDAKDIKLSSNEISNTIVVMAPRKALDFIGDLIKKLEGEGIPERQTRYYELTHAKVDEVAEYLEAHFDAGRRPGKRRKGGREKTSSAPSLNTPSFVPYPRLNLLTVLATAEQLNEIDGIVERLDVGAEDAAWKDVTLAHADAGIVAETLTQMFGTGKATVRGKKKAGPSTAAEAKFIGEQGGRMVLFSAPQRLHVPIRAAIRKLEAEAKGVKTIRVIKLENAIPGKVADAIESAYGGGGRGGKGRGRPGSSRFTITAHDPSKRLFVQADDDTFREIESLVKTLDKPVDIGFEFRIFRLQYANARQVHTQMTNLMTDYVRRLGPEARGAEVFNFSVEVDERANALIVLGSPTMFGFLEENLPKIDNPANAVGPVGTLTVALKSARAEEVAATINRLYGAKKPGSGETPPQAESNRSLNLLIVRGTKEQLAEIRKEIIDPVEQHAAAALLTETITLEYADPEVVAEEINRIFEDKQRAYQSVAGRGVTVSPLEFTVIITPQVNTRQLIVQASEENMTLVKARIAELDNKEVARSLATAVKIYAMKYAEANAVVRIINEWGRSRARGGGGKGREPAGDKVTATAEPMTHSVVVTASEANHLIVQELINGLDAESTNVKEIRTYKLKKAVAEELARALQEVYRGRKSPRRGEQPVQISAERATNSLLIVANETEMAELKTLIVSLDVEPELGPGQLESIRLNYADPWSVQDAIKQLFQAAGGRDQRDRVTVVPTFGPRSVIVSASPQNMKRVEELVAKLDTEEVGSRDVHVINVTNADAASVTQTLTEIFIRSAPRLQGGQAPPISISALKGSKALLVKCSSEDFAEIEAVVAQLDRENAVIGEEVRVVPLLYADATEVEASLREYLQKPGGRGGRGSELAGDMRLSVLTQSNALVVSGDKDGVARLQALIGQLDSAGEKGSVPQIVKLEHANPSQIAPILEEMFAQQSGGRRGQPPPVIRAIDVTKELIIRASPTDFAAIEAIVGQLDTEEAALRKNFRIVQVGTGINVRDMAEKVEMAINEGARAQAGKTRGGQTPSINIMPDTRISALIVSGDPTLFDQAEEMTRALEKMGPMGGKSMKIITLKSVPADEIERLIILLKGEQAGTGPSKRGRSSTSRRRSPARGGG